MKSWINCIFFWSFQFVSNIDNIFCFVLFLIFYCLKGENRMSENRTNQRGVGKKLSPLFQNKKFGSYLSFFLSIRNCSYLKISDYLVYLLLSQYRNCKAMYLFCLPLIHPSNIHFIQSYNGALVLDTSY